MSPLCTLRWVPDARCGSVWPWRVLAGAPHVLSITRGCQKVSPRMGGLILHLGLGGSRRKGVAPGCSHAVVPWRDRLGFGIAPGAAPTTPHPSSSPLAGCGDSRAPRFSARCAVPASAPTMPGTAPATPMRTRTCSSRCPRAQGLVLPRQGRPLAVPCPQVPVAAGPRGDPRIDGETEAGSGREEFAQGCSKPTASRTVSDAPQPPAFPGT